MSKRKLSQAKTHLFRVLVLLDEIATAGIDVGDMHTVMDGRAAAEEASLC